MKKGEGTIVFPKFLSLGFDNIKRIYIFAEEV